MKKETPKIRVRSVGEMLKHCAKYEGDLTYKCYRHRFTKYRFVKYDKNYKTIDIQDGSGGTYDVPLARCKTAGACLDWIHQLHEKTWFDAAREKEFIDLLLRLIPSSLWSGAA